MTHSVSTPTAAPSSAPVRADSPRPSAPATSSARPVPAAPLWQRLAGAVLASHEEAVPF